MRSFTRLKSLANSIFERSMGCCAADGKAKLEGITSVPREEVGISAAVAQPFMSLGP